MSEFTLSRAHRGGITIASGGLMLLSMGCTAYVLMMMAPNFLSIPLAGYFAFAAGVLSEIFKNILIPVAVFYIFRKKFMSLGLSTLAVGGLLLALSMWSTIHFFETGMLQDKQQAVVSNDRYQALTQQIKVLDESIDMQKKVLESQLDANKAKLRINHVTSSDSTGERIESAQKGLSKLAEERRSLVEERNSISITSQKDIPDYSGYYLLFSIILDIAPIVGFIILDNDRVHRIEAKATKKKNEAVQKLIKTTAQASTGSTNKATVNGPEESPGEGGNVVADSFEQYYSQVLDLIHSGDLKPSIKNIRDAIGCTEREARKINKTLKESDVLSGLAG